MKMDLLQARNVPLGLEKLSVIAHNFEAGQGRNEGNTFTFDL